MILMRVLSSSITIEDTRQTDGLYMKGQTMHWIAKSGMSGCMPDFLCATDSRKSAVDTLVNLFELDETSRKQLHHRLWLRLDARSDGAQYCEIETCDCDNMDSHNK